MSHISTNYPDKDPSVQPSAPASASETGKQVHKTPPSLSRDVITPAPAPSSHAALKSAATAAPQLPPPSSANSYGTALQNVVNATSQNTNASATKAAVAALTEKEIQQLVAAYLTATSPHPDLSTISTLSTPEIQKTLQQAQAVSLAQAGVISQPQALKQSLSPLLQNRTPEQLSQLTLALNQTLTLRAATTAIVATAKSSTSSQENPLEQFLSIETEIYNSYTQFQSISATQITNLSLFSQQASQGVESQLQTLAEKYKDAGNLSEGATIAGYIGIGLGAAAGVLGAVGGLVEAIGGALDLTVVFAGAGVVCNVIGALLGVGAGILGLTGGAAGIVAGGLSIGAAVNEGQLATAQLSTSLNFNQTNTSAQFTNLFTGFLSQFGQQQQQIYQTTGQAISALSQIIPA